MMAGVKPVFAGGRSTVALGEIALAACDGDDDGARVAFNFVAASDARFPKPAIAIGVIVFGLLVVSAMFARSRSEATFVGVLITAVVGLFLFAAWVRVRGSSSASASDLHARPNSTSGTLVAGAIKRLEVIPSGVRVIFSDDAPPEFAGRTASFVPRAPATVDDLVTMLEAIDAPTARDEAGGR